MKESRLFLGFFKKNFLIIFISSMLFLTLGFLYYKSQEPIFQKNIVLMISKTTLLDDKTDLSLNNSVQLLDHLVILGREPSFVLLLNLPKEASFQIIRVGPYLVKLIFKSPYDYIDDRQIENTINILNSKAINPFILNKIGYIDKDILEKNIYVYSLISFFGGILIGLLVSLTKTYFKMF